MRERAAFLVWIWCTAHSLNLACNDASNNEHINTSRLMIKNTYLVLYRGKGDTSRKLRTFQEAVSAAKALNNFAWWMELELGLVGDTRWVSHERAAGTIIRVLQGLLVALVKLADPAAGEVPAGVADLLRQYRSSTNVVGIFLFAALCPILSRFSSLLQSSKFCYFDILTVKTHYMNEIRRLRDSPQDFPQYYGSHVVLNAAYEGLDGFTAIDAAFICAYHKEHAQPYLTHLLERIEKRLEVTPLLQAFSSLFDASGPVLRQGGDRTLAEGYLLIITSFYNKQKQLIDENGIPTGPPIRFFSNAFVREVRSELPGVLDAFTELYQKLPDEPSKRHYSKTVPLFLNRRDLREKFPRMTEVLNISLLLPLANASPERLFSLLKRLKTRLRATIHDPTLEDLLTIALVAEYTDVDGVEEEAMRQYFETFVATKERRHEYCTYGEYTKVRAWVQEWRKFVVGM